MACPHVAGMAALMKLADKGLTPAEVKERIKSNGIDDISGSAVPKVAPNFPDAKRAYITPDLVSK